MWMLVFFLFQIYISNLAYIYCDCIKFSKVGAVELNLVFLSSMMAASRAARVAAIVVPFLLILANQTMFRALAASQARGRAFYSKVQFDKLSRL